MEDKRGIRMCFSSLKEEGRRKDLSPSLSPSLSLSPAIPGRDRERTCLPFFHPRAPRAPIGYYHRNHRRTGQALSW
jgi:hypothetical protein